MTLLMPLTWRLSLINFNIAGCSMTEHKANPEVWAAAERFGKNDMDMINCVLELRSRVEELERRLDKQEEYAQEQHADSTLSPQAQAVLDAAFTLADNLDRDVTEAEMIAAALRAVVQELKYFGITEKNILAIAAELESND
jgi:hypothetical protein